MSKNRIFYVYQPKNNEEFTIARINQLPDIGPERIKVIEYSEFEIILNALKYYANENNYDENGVLIDGACTGTQDFEFYAELGFRARQAIKDIQKSKSVKGEGHYMFPSHDHTFLSSHFFSFF